MVKRSPERQILMISSTIINDLKRHPSVERTFVYSMLVVHWEPRITLKLLKPQLLDLSTSS